MLSPIEILLIVLFSLLFCYIPWTIYFYSRRTFHPISARHPNYVVFINIIFGLTAFSNLLRAFDLNPCWSYYLMSKQLFCLAFWCVTYRFVKLGFDYEISDYIASCHQITGMKKEETKTIVPENWYHKHRWLVTPHIFYRVVAFWSTIDFLVYFLIFGIDYSHNLIPLQSFCNDSIGTMRIFFFFQMTWAGVPFISLIVFSIYILRNKSGDVFSLKIECNIMVGIGVPALLIYWLSSLYYQVNQDFGQIGPMIIFHIWYVITTVRPCFLVQKEQKKILESKNKSYEMESIGTIKHGLIDILKNPEESLLFLQYLKTEFSSENLLFWERVELLKTEPAEELFTSILFIYDHFIRENSEFQVNLPFEIVEKLKTALQTLQENGTDIIDTDAVHIFDAAQANIFDLLNNDSFPRFQRSREEKL